MTLQQPPTAGAVLSGGCLCGQVRYRATLPALQPQFCHCRLCQRATGAAFACFASFPDERFAWIHAEAAEYRSSPYARRYFCARCGTSLAFRYDGERETGVMIPTLDQPELIVPTVHWGIESRLPWLHIDDGLPQRRTEEDPAWMSARERAGRSAEHAGTGPEE